MLTFSKGRSNIEMCKVSGKVCKWKEFQAMLPSSSHIWGDKVQQLITSWSGVSGLAGVMKDKLILLKFL